MNNEQISRYFLPQNEDMILLIHQSIKCEIHERVLFLYNCQWNEVNGNEIHHIQTIDDMKDISSNIRLSNQSPPWSSKDLDSTKETRRKGRKLNGLPQISLNAVHSLYIYADLWYVNEMIPIIYWYLSMEKKIVFYSYQNHGENYSHDAIYDWLNSDDSTLFFQQILEFALLFINYTYFYILKVKQDGIEAKRKDH